MTPSSSDKDRMVLKIFGQEVDLYGSVARRALPWIFLSILFVGSVWFLQNRVLAKLDTVNIRLFTIEQKLDEHVRRTATENRSDNKRRPSLATTSGPSRVP